MSVRPRRDRPGTWLIDFRVGGQRYRQTVRAEGRRDAQAMERRIIAEVEAGAARQRYGPTLATLCARYWEEHGQHLSWHAHVRAHMDRWCDAIGDDIPAKDITSDRLAEVIGRWRTEVGPATINRRVAVLRRIWNIARDIWGAPVRPIPWRLLTQREPEPRDRSLTLAERRRFFEALPPRTRWPMMLIAATGLRRSAVLRLTRADIDWHRGVIRAVSKGERQTIVPLTEAVLAVLQAVGRLPDCGRLFAVRPHEWRRDVAAARANTGLATAGAHPLRHSFAQDLEDAGYGDMITDALHHSTPNLRRRYAKARVERMATVLDKVQR